MISGAIAEHYNESVTGCNNRRWKNVQAVWTALSKEFGRFVDTRDW